MADGDLISSRIQPVQSDAIKAQAASQAQKLANYAIFQEVSDESFNQWSELDAFNPLAIARRFESMEIKIKKKKEEEVEKKEIKEEKIQQVQGLEEVSEQFQRQNPELQARALLLLRARIKSTDSIEEILQKVLESYPDYALADEALDYLIETTEGQLQATIKKAKEEFNTLHGRAIRAGKNMGAQSREFAKLGLGSPTALRNMYRDITENPREAGILFEEFASKFPYEKLKTVLQFLLHSLGSDLKSKGPSISRAELHRLFNETRTLQSILGVYRFFRSRMRLLISAFKRKGLPLSQKLGFEFLSRLFVKFLQERYPSADKVKQIATILGLSEEGVAQIIVYTQMRDAVRNIAPRLFKSEQHRQDVLTSFIDAIDELEEELEEDEDDDTEKKKK